MKTNDNTAKVMVRRVRGRRAILALAFPFEESEALRELADSIAIKGGRSPSMSALARLGLQMVRKDHARDPAGIAHALTQLVTVDAVGKRLGMAAIN